MTADPTVVLLVGGKGTRIRSLYPDVPKPLIEVARAPFLKWVTAYLAHLGFRNFVYSCGYKGEQVLDWCQNDHMPGLQRTVCMESIPLGTGGGLINSLESCPGDWVLVANGDSLCLGGVPQLTELADTPGVDGGLIGTLCSDTSSFGSLEIAADGRLLAFREKVPGSGYINSGIYLFRKDTLSKFTIGKPLSMERDMIPQLLSDGKILHTIKIDSAPFIDIGTPETVVEATNFIIKNMSFFEFDA